MPKLNLLFCVAALGLLTACTGYRTDVDEPTIS